MISKCKGTQLLIFFIVIKRPIGSLNSK